MLQIMHVIMAANTSSTALYSLQIEWCTATCSFLMPHTELSGMVRSVWEMLVNHSHSNGLEDVHSEC